MITFNDWLIYIVSFFGLYTALFYLFTLYENWGKTTTAGRPRRYPAVAIIVPCYNEERTVGKTIESLLALDYPQERLEIVVVDDGSTDGTYKAAAQYRKRGVALLRKENGGKHTALNLALKRTKAEFVGALDADSTVEPDALRKIISRFTGPDIMAVTPSMKIRDEKGVLRRIQSVEFTMGILLRRVFADLGSQHVTPGPFTIYRRAFFEKHGYYREAHRTEDIEVALRIQSHHYQIENATDAYVYTHGPNTFRSLYKQRLRWYYGFLSNVLDYKRLFSKEHGNLGLFILPTALLSVLLVIVSGVYVLGKIVVDTWQNIQYYAAVNFDLWKMLTPHFDAFFINTNAVVIISFASLVVGLTLFFVSRRLAQDKRPWKLSYLLFFLLYWLLFAFWWLAAGAYKLAGKDTGWNHKSEYEVSG